MHGLKSKRDTKGIGKGYGRFHATVNRGLCESSPHEAFCPNPIPLSGRSTDGVGYHATVGRLLLGILLCGACSAHLGEITDNTQTDASPAIDGTTGLGPWGTPMPITGADDPVNAEDDCTMTLDGDLELIFCRSRRRPATETLFVMTRATKNDLVSAGAIAARDAQRGATTQESPRLSLDDKTICTSAATATSTPARARRSVPRGPHRSRWRA